MKPAQALGFKVSCIRPNLPDGCICTTKRFGFGAKGLFFGGVNTRPPHPPCLQAGGLPGSSGRRQGKVLSCFLAAFPPAHPPASTTATTPSCQPTPQSAGPRRALFRTHPHSRVTLEAPRAQRRVQDGAVRGQSWSLRDRSTSCPWLTPHHGDAVSPCSTQGCSLPAARLLLWQQFPLQLLGFSLAAPGAKHNTSLPLRLPAAPAALCFQPPKAGSSASSWGSPPRVLLHPQDLLPSQAHIWGWHSWSPNCFYPSQRSEALCFLPPRSYFLGYFLDTVPGSQLASPAGCCNSGAGVRRSQGDDAQSIPPPLPAGYFPPEPREASIPSA